MERYQALCPNGSESQRDPYEDIHIDDDPIDESHLLQWSNVPRSGLTIDTTRALDVDDETKDIITRHTGGIDRPLVANIKAGKQEFIVLDSRGSANVPFFLAQPNDDEAGRWATKGIWPDKTLVVGRSHLNDRFHYGENISRDHFSIRWDSGRQQLRIADLGSMNGTMATCYTDLLAAQQSSGIKADYTEAIQNYIHGSEYCGYPLITRDSSIAGGVYGTKTSEMCVVNDRHFVVDGAVRRVLQNIDDSHTRNVLQSIEKGTAATLHYDFDATEQMSRPYCGKLGLVYLNEYIEAGVGVCRHQALFAGLCIERAISEGLLGGNVHVERNFDRTAPAGHAWAVYCENGVDYIVDPANHVVDEREAANRLNVWRYRMEEDRVTQGMDPVQS